MCEYVLSGCSTADLSSEHFFRRDIKYICFHYELDGVPYEDDLGKSMSFETFYASMANGAMTKTSQINAEEYEDYFRTFLEEGKDIIHVTLSSGISGTINSAKIAADNLSDEYPGKRIYIVDSLGASAGYGLLLDKMADLRDNGMSIDDLMSWAVKNRLRLHHWFFSTDLTFYIRGGRISKTAGFFGGMLNICPLLNMDNLGRLIPREKIRTKKKVISTIVAKMVEHADDCLNYSEKCFISHSACKEDAEEVAKLVEERFPHMKGKVEIFSIGTVIGSHTGPGTVALFFWGDEREA
ncbi:MAG: DegV family protein [Lachnospiraceae bacterium]|nr:DegV family protein [Lachnospiraceae bacterium]